MLPSYRDLEGCRGWAQLQHSYQRASTTKGITPTVEGELLETMGLLLEIGGQASAALSNTQLACAKPLAPARSEPFGGDVTHRYSWLVP